MTDAPPQTDAAVPTDAALLRDAALLEAWRAAATGGRQPFTIPGHKGRAGRVSPLLGELLRSDVALFGGLAPVKLAPGLLTDAERRAASRWGADWCRFVTGGSTQANQITALAIGRPGATVLVSRAVHRSSLTGLVLAGLEPVWLPVDAAGRVPVGTVRRALTDHPRAAALLLVDPGYLGTRSELALIVELAHSSGVPVVVDQAWAPHFGFHSGLPPHALAVGADAMVISAHKTLPAYSPASLVFAQRERLDLTRWDRAADALLTTSPPGSVLASIDAASALLASPPGTGLLDRLLRLVARTRHELRAAGLAADAADDPTKLVVRLPGHDGLAIERDLIAAAMPVELAERDLLVPIVTLVDDEESVQALTSALLDSAQNHPGGPWPPAIRPPDPVVTHSPRAAFFADRVTVPAEAAVGRTSAELIAPYPPGVAVVAPGELVTVDVLDALRDARDRGARIAYAADPSLSTFAVLSDRPGS